MSRTPDTTPDSSMDTPAAVRRMLARHATAVTPPLLAASVLPVPDSIPTDDPPAAATTVPTIGGEGREKWRFTPVEWALTAGAVMIAILGFISSFDGVSRMAVRVAGFSPRLAPTVPASIDLSILVASAYRVILTRRSVEVRLTPRWLRWAIYGLTGVTVYANMSVTDRMIGKVLHAVMVSLWVAFVEGATFVARRLMQLEDEERIQSIPRSRWLLSPLPTLRLWRRMVQWQITRYQDALDLEAEIQDLKVRLRHTYGRRWRWKAPAQKILEYRRLVRLSPRKSMTDRAPVTPTSTVPATIPAPVSVPATQPVRRQRSPRPSNRPDRSGTADRGTGDRVNGTPPTGTVTGQADRAPNGELTGDDLLVSHLTGPIMEAMARGEEIGRPRARRILTDALPGQTLPGSDRMRRILDRAEREARAAMGSTGQVVALTGHRSNTGA